MKQYFSDQRLEAIFSKLTMNETEKLTCSQGHEIIRICINPECQNALMCNEDSCKCCGEQLHPLCPSTSFSSIKNSLKKKAKEHKEFIYQIFELEKKFMNQIYETRSKFIKDYEYNFVRSNFRQLLAQIFQKNKNKALNGQKALQFHNYLRCVQTQKEEKIKDWKKSYQTYLSGVQTEMIHKNHMFFELFAEKKSLIDSKILTQKSKVQISQMEYLKQSLGNFTNIQLIFRGSEHGFSAKCFHAHCDDVQNTLTLVKTQKGKTVAGFTKARWGLSKVIDKQTNKAAFLLQLDSRQKFVPNNSNHVIASFPQWGPIFGSGGVNCDLAISDNCHITKNSRSHFPAQFNRQGDDKLIKSHLVSHGFIGVNNSQMFLVEEYQVFKVIYD